MIGEGMSKINWKRVTLALVFSPLLGLFLIALFLLGAAIFQSGMSNFEGSFYDFAGFVVMTLSVGGLFAYPAVLFFGLPLIIYFEKRRFSKKKCIISGGLIAVTLSLLIAGFLNEEGIWFLFPLASLFITSFISIFMYYKRDDW